MTPSDMKIQEDILHSSIEKSMSIECAKRQDESSIPIVVDSMPIIVSSSPPVAPLDGRCLINKLPTELLSLIFLLGRLGPDHKLKDEDAEKKENDHDTRGFSCAKGTRNDRERFLSFELLVSHVCRRWREVAIDTAMLWTYIGFKEGLPHEKSTTYLERSKNAPLVIRITKVHNSSHMASVSEPASKRSNDEITAFIGLVVPHVSHWHTFALTLSDYSLIHQTLIRLSECPTAPMLELLHLSHESDTLLQSFSPAIYKEQNFVLFSGNAPKLKDVTLFGVHLNWAESRFLNGLVNLELAYHAEDVRPSFKDFARVLRKSPAIRSMTLRSSGPAGELDDWLASVSNESADQPTLCTIPSVSTPDMTIVLPSLLCLDIAELKPGYLTQLYEYLILPNIASLIIDLGGDNYTSFAHALMRPTSYTGASLLTTLSSLQVDNVQLDAVTDIPGVYSALLHLRTLKLNLHNLDPRWFSWVDTGPEHATPMPFLEMLVTIGLDGKAARELIQFRKAVNRPILRLFMDDGEKLEPEDRYWLEQNTNVFGTFSGWDMVHVGE